MIAYKKWLIQQAKKLVLADGIDGDLQTSVAALLLMDLQMQKEISFDLMIEMADKVFYSDEVILDVAKKIIDEEKN